MPIKELIIKTNDPKNTWVAIDIMDGSTIIAEGKSPEEVEKIAKSKGATYMLSFVPKSGASYIL